MRTKEQFQAQFPREIDYETVEPYLQFDEIVCETPVYRALNKLVIIKDNGRYYVAP